MTDSPLANVMAAPKRQLRVLVADDYALNRKILGIMLGKHDIAPDFVSSGEAALEAVRKHSYDAIIMDLHMPGIGGREAARRIRSETGYQRPHVIALSARIQGDEEAQSLFDSSLEKPATAADIVRVLQDLNTPEYHV